MGIYPDIGPWAYMRRITVVRCTLGLSTTLALSLRVIEIDGTEQQAYTMSE